MSIIEIKSIIKRYENNLAVDNLSLSIEKGEIFGLLGPNGAGKSTTIKMIIGLLNPGAGEIFVRGLNMKNKNESMEAKRVLGLVPQDIAVHSNMTAKENVLFFGSLYGLRGEKLRKSAEEALEFSGLLDKQNEKPKKFSGGMKRRLNIACAIVHSPEILILDEPTVGIDPQSRNHILESIRELNSRGTTVIYTSHYMEEVEALCSRVGIIDHGRLIACGTMEELKNMVSEDEKILLDINKPSFSAVNEIKGLGGIKNVKVEDGEMEIIAGSSQELVQDVLFILAKNDVKVKSFKLVEPDLESLFLSLTGRKLRD